MKYLKSFEDISEYERIINSNKIYSFERTFSLDDKKLLNIIDMLNQKNIDYKLYYYYYNDIIKKC